MRLVWDWLGGCVYWRVFSIIVPRQRDWHYFHSIVHLSLSKSHYSIIHLLLSHLFQTQILSLGFFKKNSWFLILLGRWGYWIWSQGLEGSVGTWKCLTWSFDWVIMVVSPCRNGIANLMHLCWSCGCGSNGPFLIAKDHMHTFISNYWEVLVIVMTSFIFILSLLKNTR